MTNSSKLFTAIARECLHIPTLRIRNRDALDFHEVSVWGVKAALRAAYHAGRDHERALMHRQMQPLAGLCERVQRLVLRMTAVAQAAFPYHGDDQHSVETEDAAIIEAVATLLTTVRNRMKEIPEQVALALTQYLDHLDSCVCDHEQYQATLQE